MDAVKFEELYKLCFDENDNIKACGRDVCKRLLIFLGDSKYGNADTGMMNPGEIIKLHYSLRGD